MDNPVPWRLVRTLRLSDEHFPELAYEQAPLRMDQIAVILQWVHHGAYLTALSLGDPPRLLFAFDLDNFVFHVVGVLGNQRLVVTVLAWGHDRDGLVRPQGALGDRVVFVVADVLEWCIHICRIGHKRSILSYL
jgi:hypothetical protein